MATNVSVLVVLVVVLVVTVCVGVETVTVTVVLALPEASVTAGGVLSKNVSEMPPGLWATLRTAHIKTVVVAQYVSVSVLVGAVKVL